MERDASLLGGLFDHERLAGWLSEAGQTFRYDANGLASVEASIDSWNGNSDIAPMLANEVGTFLGTVLVKVVDGASWHVWSNGHPVVRVIPKRDIDVVDLAEIRINSGRPNPDGRPVGWHRSPTYGGSLVVCHRRNDRRQSRSRTLN